MLQFTQMEFKDWLKNVLETRGIKPSELSYRSGLSHAEISRLLSGKRLPSAKTIKKIAPFLHVGEEEALRAANYLSPEREKPTTIELPVVGYCPADKFNFAFEDVVDTVVMNFSPDLKNCFAVRAKGDCMKDAGIFNGDIVIVSPHAQVNNGDIVIARISDECTLKKFFRTNDQVILQPCNSHYDPIIVNPKEKTIEIIGKVIRALKTFA